MSRGGEERPEGVVAIVLAATMPTLGLALFVAIGIHATPEPAAAQQQVGDRAAPVFLDLPRVEGLPLPADFEASRRTAGRALGIHSVDEMVRLSHTDRPPVEGSRPVLVLPALFEDSPEPVASADEIRQVLFDGPADPGTLTEFYDEMSRGRLDVTGEVTPWLRTRITLQEAAGELNGHGWLGDSLRAYVKHAIELADEHVDYGQFDNDGPDGIPNSGDDDGFVDLLVVSFPAVAGSCGGPGPWPHAGGLLSGTDDDPIDERGPVPTDDDGPDGDPIRISSYIGQSAVDCTGQAVHSPAVVAHEIGHLLGVGDYYDAARGIEPEKRRWLVGCFGLMSAGAWGCGDGEIPPRFGPTHMAPHTRSFLGWLDLEEVPPGRNMIYELEPSQTSGRALRVPLGPDASAESFLVEYRPRLGFDRALPAGGVLVYHLDRFRGRRNLPNDRPRPSFFHLVEADGDYGLLTFGEEGGDRGVAADVFARSGAVDSFTATTTPATEDHLGQPSAVAFHAMEVVGGRARIRISYDPGFGAVNQSMPAAVQALDTFDGHFEIVGGEPPFDVRPVDGEELPDGLQFVVEDRLVRLQGPAFEAGSHRLEVVVEDDAERTAGTELTFFISDLNLPRETLVEALLDPSSAVLNEEEIRYLDASGHRNGELDVADVRAALERRRLLEPPGGGP